MKLPTIEQHIKGWLLVIVLGGGLLGYLRFIDGTLLRPVIDLDQTSFEHQTTQQVYTAGDRIEIKSRQFCKLRDVEAEGNFVLHDGVILPFVEKTVNIPVGCYDGGKLLTLVELPEFIGGHGETYMIKGTTCYRVNPIRKICYPFTTNLFTVNKKSP